MKNYHPKYVGAVTDKGPNRPGNEDACWIPAAQTPTELGALYIVADGVGGHEYGELASQAAIEVISDQFYQLRRRGVEIISALEQVITEANQQLLALAKEKSVTKTSSTVVTAVQYEGNLYIAHVGDARAYLLRNKTLRQLTRDDTWVQKQVDAKVITQEEAAKHEFRNVVTQALGNRADVEVHISEAIPLENGDVLLLCSDGLHGTLSEEELTTLLKQSPAQAASALVQAAIEANATDNVTAVVVQTSPNPKVIQVPTPSPSRSYLWVIAAVFAFGLLATAVFLWLNSGFNPFTLGTSDPTRLPTLAPTSPPIPTAIPATETAVLIPTSTLAPTQTPTPPFTATPTATATPTGTPVLAGCVIEIPLFVWQDDDILGTECNAIAENELTLGEEVIILDNIARFVTGPDPFCLENEMIKVQSVTRSEVSGWVLYSAIITLQPGQTCSQP